MVTYFEPNCRVTNATVEGKNHLIRKSDAIGNGYSWRVLWAKIMLRDMVLVHGNFTLGARLEATTRVIKGKLVRPSAFDAVSMLFTDRSAFPDMELDKSVIQCYKLLEQFRDLEKNAPEDLVFDRCYDVTFEIVAHEPNCFHEPFYVGTNGFKWDNIAENLIDLDDLDDDHPDHDLFLIGDFVKECLREMVLAQQAKDYAKHEKHLKKNAQGHFLLITTTERDFHIGSPFSCFIWGGVMIQNWIEN